MAMCDRCVLGSCVCVRADGILNTQNCNHGVGLKTALKWWHTVTKDKQRRQRGKETTCKEKEKKKMSKKSKRG